MAVAEARIAEGALLKKLIEAMKDLVTEANFDCDASGISLQAMDSSHVSLVAMQLKADGFEHYRCDRNMSIGMNLASLSKILKCANNDDVITLKAEDDAEVVTFMFESPNQEKISDFELKLMEIDSEHLGIPETDYCAEVTMPGGEFQKICRDLTTFGDTATIAATKEGVKFSVSGDIGTGNVTVRQNAAADKEQQTLIELQEPVSLTFALRYLNFFTKATPMSDQVTLSLSKEVPLAVEYAVGEMGHLRYYLAPKVDEDEE
jgi:proliferating cell nuclear antigen